MKNTHKLNKSELFGAIVDIIFGLIRQEKHKLVINIQHKFTESNFTEYVQIKQKYEDAIHVDNCWKSNIECLACKYHVITNYSSLLFNLYQTYTHTLDEPIQQSIYETISGILFGDKYENTNKTEKEIIKESSNMILNTIKKYKIL